MNRQELKANLDFFLNSMFDKNIKTATVNQLHYAIGKLALLIINKKANEKEYKRKASYLSMEFLMGRAIYNNLLNLSLVDDIKSILEEQQIDFNIFEEVEDAALGNGGLGRLAACFLDSAATHNIPLNGYGIRYRYGLFKQEIENGFQKEIPDDWLRFDDPWSIKKEDEKILINFKDEKVYAVPYDMPIIGYHINCVNYLRLYEAEAYEPFDFNEFNKEQYDNSVRMKNRAEDIYRVLYPNDLSDNGKMLRLKQEYFLSSASLQHIIKNHKKNKNIRELSKYVAIQLNDTHPVLAIPELIRILVNEEDFSFLEGLKMSQEIFSFTNHTLMVEAMEKWNMELIENVVPHLIPILKELDNHFSNKIIKNNMVSMVDMASLVCHKINGVAKIHSEILKNKELKEFHAKIINITNGVTQRRWLLLANKELSSFISQLIGDEWITNLEKLKDLEKFKDDINVHDRIFKIRLRNKEIFNKYANVNFDTQSIFDVQVKRLHEYKRQLMNILSVLDIYFRIKDENLYVPKTTFIFGAKSAPGYFRAKAIIKLISEVEKLIEKENLNIKVAFVKNYSVSLAEKIIPATDFSEQISTAGTEASGTGNMKFMLNGAPTIGTYDGANIEISDYAGGDNEYLFGLRVEEIENLSYDPQSLNEGRIKKVLNTLIDGTLNDDNTGMFKELYNSLLYGASYHKPDNYFVLKDLEEYTNTRLKAFCDYENDKHSYFKKVIMNIANSGMLSSDRTVKEYNNLIWHI